MSTKSLYKLFYANPDEYKSEYLRRFNDEKTIHLEINIGKHPAFVFPNHEIYNLIISIERTNNLVSLLCKELPPIALNQFQERCLVDEIVLSNRIEGVHSTRKEISSILQDLSKSNKRQRFVGLVNKYQLLMTSQKIRLESSSDIRKIYDDIFYEEIEATDPEDLPDGAVFRKKSVSVYSESGKEIHQGLFPESKIIDAIDKSLDVLNNESIDYLIRISLFHYLFGYIHPFYDGNGRTSRFISSYLLSQKLNNLIGYRISYTIKENIKDYYDAFKICNHYNNKGDLTPFVEMFLKIVDTSMKQLHNAVSERYEKLVHYLKLIRDLPNADDESMFRLYDVLIQAALFSDTGIANQELKEYMQMSYNTMKDRLNRIPNELIIIKRQGNILFYHLALDEIDRLFDK